MVVWSVRSTRGCTIRRAAEGIPYVCVRVCVCACVCVYVCMCVCVYVYMCRHRDDADGSETGLWDCRCFRPAGTQACTPYVRTDDRLFQQRCSQETVRPGVAWQTHNTFHTAVPYCCSSTLRLPLQCLQCPLCTRLRPTWNTNDSDVRRPQCRGGPAGVTM